MRFKNSNIKLIVTKHKTGTNTILRNIYLYPLPVDTANSGSIGITVPELRQFVIEIRI